MSTRDEAISLSWLGPRQLWLAGALLVPLLLEAVAVADHGARVLPLTACSIAMAATAWFAARRPLPAALAGAAVAVSSAVLASVTTWTDPYPGYGGIPVTQLMAGLILTATVIRHGSRADYLAGVPILGVAAGSAALLDNHSAHEARALLIPSPVMVAVVLALGLALSAAIGAWLRVAARR